MASFTPGSACFRGLSEMEAQALLKAEGHNELPQSEHRTLLRIIIDVMREPMLVLLVSGGVIYLILGDLAEAVIMVIFGTLSVGITVIQETRTEQALEKLRDLTSPRALVVRDGIRRRIAGRDVVRGDIVILAEGDRVPADAMLLDTQNLQIDESLLTGESVPVQKQAGPPSQNVGTCAQDHDARAFSGTLVVRGSGIGRISATGLASEIGKIGQSLNTIEVEPPRLQAETRRLVTTFAAMGAVVSVLAVLLHGFLRGGWLEAVLGGIALGMSMLPEEFPVVLTVFMAMGAWRIARARVLTRRASAIETLGSATVLCTDKTGTLTENRMSVAELRLEQGENLKVAPDSRTPIPPNFHNLAVFSVLASSDHAVDPMERAIRDLRHERSGGIDHLFDDRWRLVHTFGLRPELPAMSQVWETSGHSAQLIVAAKGAPEAIAHLCGFSEHRLLKLKETLDAMAADGLRMLGVARASLPDKTLPDSQENIAFEFLGLVGLADPLRPGVREAVDQCRTAGIKVVMITGDHPATARAIALRAGIDATSLVTGDELHRLDDAKLDERLETTTIFARITPDQKHRIVERLKAGGATVAMTGDGVNDAPSLKAAHIGIAMGSRGTDVAREASSIVLLDDDFNSIVRSVRLGRRIYDNLRKAMVFILSVHVPVAGMALMPLLFGTPILLGPIHIAFLEMIIDPVCSLAFEAEDEEKDIMQRPPRPPNERLFSVPLMMWSLFQGALTLTFLIAVFAVVYDYDMPGNEMRALLFFALVVSIVSLIFVNRSYSPSLITTFARRNPVLIAVLLAVSISLSLTLLWPRATSLFRFGPLHLDDLALAAGVGLSLLVTLEVLKALWARRPGWTERPLQARRLDVDAF
ncbi:MAG: cation-translocating P-type ATPase [Afipia sp.]